MGSPWKQHAFSSAWAIKALMVTCPWPPSCRNCCGLVPESWTESSPELRASAGAAVFIFHP